MDLKDRKRINNLPKFNLGLTNAEIGSMDPMALFKQANGGSVPSVVPSITPNLGPAQISDKGMAAVNKNIADSLSKLANGGIGGFLKNKGGDIMNAAATAIDAVSTFSSLGKNKMSSDEMMGSGGQFEDSANGISYQQSKVDQAGIQNQINATAKAATMTGITKGSELGGTIGNFFGPIGGAVGKIGGALLGGIAGGILGNKAKREAERLKLIAIDRTNAGNTQNRETAYTIGLRNEFNRENRTDASQSLFHAEEGKEGAVNPRTGATYKRYTVNTAYGKAKAPQNAWVSKGEIIRSKDGSLHRVNEGPNDTARAYLQNGDSVYSKKVINPETGNPVADDAPVYAAMGMLDRLDMNLNVGRMLKYTGKRKGNLLPGYLGGTPGGFGQYRGGGVAFAPELEDDYNPQIQSVVANTGTTATAATSGADKASPSNGPGFFGRLGKGLKGALGAVNSIGGNFDLGNLAMLGNAYMTAAQRDARAQGLRAPKSFMANPYEQDSLQQLNSLHSDYYPVWSQNREIEGRGKSAIALSGGLSAGQRMLGYMGLTNQTQQNNAAAMFEHQGRENALRAQAANAALQAGAQTAQRQQQAYQWDEDMLAKAHAARENMLETSAYDRQNALGSFFKNKWEKERFDRNMSLYEADLQIERDKIQNLLNNNSNLPAQQTLQNAHKPTLADEAKKVVVSQTLEPLSEAVKKANVAAKVKQQPIKPGKNVKRGVKRNSPAKQNTTGATKSGGLEGTMIARPEERMFGFTPDTTVSNAIKERFPDATKAARQARPNKEKPGRVAPQTNSEALGRLWERMKFGKKEYERRYGKN